MHMSKSILKYYICDELKSLLLYFHDPFEINIKYKFGGY